MAVRQIFVFDFDGTIADSLPSMIRILNRMAPRMEFLPITAQFTETIRSIPIREAFRHLEIQFWRIPQVVAEVRSSLQTEVDQLQPVTGILPVLTELHAAGCELGILTSNSPENVNAFLARHQIEHLISFVTGGSSLFGKHRHLRRWLNLSNTPPECVTYVGDEVRDIDAAHKVGIAAAAVSWGFNNRALLQTFSPEYIFDNPEDLLSLIDPEAGLLQAQ